MATKKAKEEAAHVSPPALEPLYSISLRMQVSSLAGDAEYHLRMRRDEIEGILSGKATCVRLPSRYGPSRALGHANDEWRFLPLSNIVEITLFDFEWPAADYIAEAEG